ncbi:MAG TPA: DUF4352 domain-containing protein, partial [Pseudonocardia sp.]|nr:DUF4352 domain-containing protein [Pseudonocardia sp.]
LALSWVGLAHARAGRSPNRDQAQAGIACSATGLGVCVLYLVAVYVLALSAAGVVAPSEGVYAAQPPFPSAGIGEEVRDGPLALRVVDVEPGGESLGDWFTRTEADGSYLLVDITVTNLSDTTQFVDDSSHRLVDTWGRRWIGTDVDAAMYGLESDRAAVGFLGPGATMSGTLVFDVPDDFDPAAVELRATVFGPGAMVALDG